MAQTGHILGKDCSIKIKYDSGSTALTDHGNSIDIDYNADDHEATAFGDSSHTYLQGLTNFTLGYSGWWAGSHASDIMQSVVAVLHTFVTYSSTCRPEIWIAPAGSTAGSLCYGACVNVQSFPMSFPSDSIATMNLSFTARAGSLTATSAYP